ncbi:hypothetical protein N7523_009761 [Penicillium sp. IBT 18751x]|nr:hypothetical protein N7523_009761 [Penicillium sp. IBT 18751x]
MAPPKVFVTGATGYVGGDWLYTISNAHPDWQLSALIRSKEKASQVTTKYPHLRVVHGDLESVDIIEEEVKNADIVFNFADCDHVASAQAIAKAVEDQHAGTFGIQRPKEYNDWDGVNELINLPEDALHRNVDKIIIDAGKNNPSSVHTAIVCPPTIYGPSRGPGNTKSLQAYKLSVGVLKRGKGIILGKGENIWHEVYVQDLSNVYLALGEAAAAGGGKATWNDEGYYLAENGSFVWGDIEREVAKQAFTQKFIPSPDVDIVDAGQAQELHKWGPYFWVLTLVAMQSVLGSYSDGTLNSRS